MTEMSDPFAPDVLRVYLNERGYPHACVRGHIEKRRCVRECDCTIYVPVSKMENAQAERARYREALERIAGLPGLTAGKVLAQNALKGEGG